MCDYHISTAGTECLFGTATGVRLLGTRNTVIRMETARSSSEAGAYGRRSLTSSCRKGSPIPNRPVLHSYISSSTSPHPWRTQLDRTDRSDPSPSRPCLRVALLVVWLPCCTAMTSAHGSLRRFWWSAFLTPDSFWTCKTIHPLCYWIYWYLAALQWLALSACREDISGQRSMRSVYSGVVHLQVSVRRCYQCHIHDMVTEERKSSVNVWVCANN